MKRLNLYLQTWAVIEKSRPEYDPKLTRLCELLPTESRLWRRFRSKYKDYLGPSGSNYFEVGDGSGDMNVICSRPEVADDVISGADVDIFRSYACVNLWVDSFISFREHLNQPFM